MEHTRSKQNSGLEQRIEGRAHSGFQPTNKAAVVVKVVDVLKRGQHNGEGGPAAAWAGKS